MPPPPLAKKTPTPNWQSQVGAELKEDAGGKYYEVRYEITDKIYVYPNFRVEQVSAFVRRPVGYKGKKAVRASSAVSPVKKAVVEEPAVIKVKEESW